MSTATATEGAVEVPEEEHDHPSDALYWKIGITLGLLTALEVSAYFIADPPYDHNLAPLIIGGLLFLMVAKFIIIGAFFMHLKFDSKLFRAVFIAGLVLAVIVYLVMMVTFRYFTDDYEAALAVIAR